MNSRTDPISLSENKPKKCCNKNDVDAIYLDVYNTTNYRLKIKNNVGHKNII
jgi:hypothetical protein